MSLSASLYPSPVDPHARLASTPERLDFALQGPAHSTAFDRYHAFYTLGSDVAPAGERFRASIACTRLDRMVLHDRRLRSVTHSRGIDRARRDDLAHFTVTLCLDGTMFGAGSQGFRRVRPGEIWLADMTQPVRTRIEDARLVTLAVSRDVVETATHRPGALHATVVSRERAAGLADALLRLVDRSAALSVPDAAAAEDEVTRLVGSMLGSPSTADAQRLARLARARQVIDDRLDQPDLDAETLAANLHVSRSTVYRLFAASGGVARVIQARRLERLRRLLSERDVDASIADLANLVGLASESHASRLFLGRYGLRPGAFRTGTRDPSDFAVGLVRMSGWLAELQ